MLHRRQDRSAADSELLAGRDHGEWRGYGPVLFVLLDEVDQDQRQWGIGCVIQGCNVYVPVEGNGNCLSR